MGVNVCGAAVLDPSVGGFVLGIAHGDGECEGLADVLVRVGGEIVELEGAEAAAEDGLGGDQWVDRGLDKGIEVGAEGVVLFEVGEAITVEITAGGEPGCGGDVVVVEADLDADGVEQALDARVAGGVADGDLAGTLDVEVVAGEAEQALQEGALKSERVVLGDLVTVGGPNGEDLGVLRRGVVLEHAIEETEVGAVDDAVAVGLEEVWILGGFVCGEDLYKGLLGVERVGVVCHGEGGEQGEDK